MIEDDDRQIEVEQGGEALLYDYFKHLTSLCLVSLGGVLALTEKAKGVKPELQIAALVVIGLAGTLSFSGAAEIVRSRFRRVPAGKALNVYRVCSPTLLFIGVGMFLYLFTKTLRV